MKMTPAQKARLALLLGKTAVSLTDTENAELVTLKALAVKEALVLDEKFITDHPPIADDNTAMTPDQVKELVAESLSAVLAEKGIDQVKLIDAVNAANKGHLTAEAVKGIIAEATKGFNTGGAPVDMAAILKSVKDTMESAQAGAVTADVLVKALGDFAKSQTRTAPLNQYPSDNGVAFDIIEHRNGNLTVAQKQMLNIMLKKDQNDGIKAEILTRATTAGTKALVAFSRYGAKALTTSGSGSGAELIPSDLSSDLQMRLYLESQLASAMMATEINMPTDTYKIPLKGSQTTFYVGSEAPGSDPTASYPSTAQIVLDAKKLIGVADYSYEMDEDSIVPVLPMLQNDLAEGAIASLEDALINGDTTGTHQDTDTQAVAAHAARLFKGFRKLALAGSSIRSLATGGISAANILALKKQMLKWGVKPSDVAVIVGPNGFNDLLGLPETLTVDKMGNSALARIISGLAATIYGMPIIVSEKCREDLDATGVNGASGNTKGSILLVHRPSWYMGTRRGFLVETDEDKKKQTRSVIASFRRDLQPKETVSAAMPLVVLGYNYTA